MSHDPPNRYVMPDGAVNGDGPGLPPSTEDADLADVLVNYEEVFRAVHMRYFQNHSAMMQEIAELRAGFNQAVARMHAAEAEVEALRKIVAARTG